MALDWLKLHVQINTAGRVRCEPGWRLDEQFAARIRDCDLWFVWSGRGRMRLRKSDIELRPGVCVWMRPGGNYHAEQDPHDRLGVTFVHFDLLLPDGGRLLAEHQLPPEVHDLPDVQYVDAVGRRVVDLFRQHRPSANSPNADALSAAEALFRGLLIDIDCGLALPDSARDDIRPGTQMHHYRVISALASRIAENPQAIGTISDLAVEAGYSGDHFTRVFKRITGQSPQQFLVQARINRARQLLVESSLSVTQIARAVGYEDVYAFSNQFKQQTGRTPSSYRKGDDAA